MLCGEFTIVKTFLKYKCRNFEIKIDDKKFNLNFLKDKVIKLIFVNGNQQPLNGEYIYIDYLGKRGVEKLSENGTYECKNVTYNSVISFIVYGHKTNESSITSLGDDEFKVTCTNIKTQIQILCVDKFGPIADKKITVKDCHGDTNDYVLNKDGKIELSTFFDDSVVKLFGNTTEYTFSIFGYDTKVVNLTNKTPFKITFEKDVNAEFTVTIQVVANGRLVGEKHMVYVGDAKEPYVTDFDSCITIRGVKYEDTLLFQSAEYGKIVSVVVNETFHTVDVNATIDVDVKCKNQNGDLINSVIKINDGREYIPNNGLIVLEDVTPNQEFILSCENYEDVKLTIKDGELSYEVVFKNELIEKVEITCKSMGKLLPNKDITVNDIGYITNESGKLELKELPKGSKISLSIYGYGTEFIYITGTRHEVHFKPTPTIKFKVTNNYDGKIVSGATFKIGENIVGISDANGLCELKVDIETEIIVEAKNHKAKKFIVESEALHGVVLEKILEKVTVYCYWVTTKNKKDKVTNATIKDENGTVLGKTGTDGKVKLTNITLGSKLFAYKKYPETYVYKDGSNGIVKSESLEIEMKPQTKYSSLKVTVQLDDGKKSPPSKSLKVSIKDMPKISGKTDTKKGVVTLKGNIYNESFVVVGPFGDYLKTEAKVGAKEMTILLKKEEEKKDESSGETTVVEEEVAGENMGISCITGWSATTSQIRYLYYKKDEDIIKYPLNGMQYGTNQYWGHRRDKNYNQKLDNVNNLLDTTSYGLNCILQDDDKNVNDADKTVCTFLEIAHLMGMEMKKNSSKQILEHNKERIEVIKQKLDNFKISKIKVLGSASESGTAAANSEISSARANMVKKWLKTNKVNLFEFEDEEKLIKRSYFLLSVLLELLIYGDIYFTNKKSRKPWYLYNFGWCFFKNSR